MTTTLTRTVTYHPILFSGPMVKAILDGRKTQTRRVIRHLFSVPPDWYPDRYNKTDQWTFWGPRGTPESGKCSLPLFRCPYGQPGDRLWVREAWSPWANRPAIIYRADNVIREYSDPLPHLLTMYMDDDNNGWRPSIHMSRWASRLTLEITGVRVERVQEISEGDAKDEGVYVNAHGVWSVDGVGWYSCPSGCFRDRWNALNGKRNFGWEENPWVWVIEFRRLP
jgi:hypothetical protein